MPDRVPDYVNDERARRARESENEPLCARCEAAPVIADGALCVVCWGTVLLCMLDLLALLQSVDLVPALRLIWNDRPVSE